MRGGHGASETEAADAVQEAFAAAWRSAAQIRDEAAFAPQESDATARAKRRIDESRKRQQGQQG